eukprot:TRINITY_DN20195_c0_g2_i1.p2 TRINITY_DN20195_c0_g2~~TRINITY_DN20195_c0_g2_i1.p2  ORF type:complete len:119 (-),score=9.71 TRINITY_DN20195_c0_g2_i1:12-323(-)
MYSPSRASFHAQEDQADTVEEAVIDSTSQGTSEDDTTTSPNLNAVPPSGGEPAYQDGYTVEISPGREPSVDDRTAFTEELLIATARVRRSANRSAKSNKWEFQ